MANISNTSSLRGTCMKCRKESPVLLSTCTPSRVIGYCHHKFCQSCFTNEHISIATSSSYKFKCPCCGAAFYDDIQSIDEAIVVGEAATIRMHVTRQLSVPPNVEISHENIIRINEMNKLIIDKLQVALKLNPTNFDTLYLLFTGCSHGNTFLTEHQHIIPYSEFYRLKIYDYSFKLLDHSDISMSHESVRDECWLHLACTFHAYNNYSAALKYSKLAYEHCLRSSDHTNLAGCKAIYLQYRTVFAQQPSLRFAVGDEVEFLHECETGSEWKLGKVVELYYRGISKSILVPPIVYSIST